MEKLEQKKFNRCDLTTSFGEWNFQHVSDTYWYVTKLKIEDGVVKGYKEKYDVEISYLQEIEKISENEFFLISGLESGSKRLRRVKLSEGQVTENYTIDFRTCYQLSDDLILFNQTYFLNFEGKLYDHKSNIYSISQNQNIQDFEWLSNGYEVTPVKLEEENKVALHVMKTIESKYGNSYIQFLVDSTTFQPISEVHSTLRTDKVRVANKEEVEKVINEDIELSKIATSNELRRDFMPTDLFTRK